VANPPGVGFFQILLGFAEAIFLTEDAIRANNYHSTFFGGALGVRGRAARNANFLHRFWNKITGFR
jgi:hypothetical protein